MIGIGFALEIGHWFIRQRIQPNKEIRNANTCLHDA